MPRLPRLPRRRPRWQRAGVKTLRGGGELAAWIGIGFAAVAAADTAPSGGWGDLMYGAVFATVLGAGGYLLWYGPKIVRTVRLSRTPRRHRRNQSSISQIHNLSRRGLSRVLNWRFRRG